MVSNKRFATYVNRLLARIARRIRVGKIAHNEYNSHPLVIEYQRRTDRYLARLEIISSCPKEG